MKKEKRYTILEGDTLRVLNLDDSIAIETTETNQKPGVRINHETAQRHSMSMLEILDNGKRIQTPKRVEEKINDTIYR